MDKTVQIRLKIAIGDDMYLRTFRVNELTFESLCSTIAKLDGAPVYNPEDFPVKYKVGPDNITIASQIDVDEAIKYAFDFHGDSPLLVFVEFPQHSQLLEAVLGSD